MIFSGLRNDSPAGGIPARIVNSLRLLALLSRAPCPVAHPARPLQDASLLEIRAVPGTGQILQHFRPAVITSFQAAIFPGCSPSKTCANG